LSWAEGVVANFARTPTGNDRDQARAVISGLGEVAIMNTYYLILMENSSDPADREVASRIGVIFPENTHMNLSYAAILNKAANAAHAQMFIDYLLAVEQQTLFMNGNGEFPVRDDITLNSTIQSWGEFTVAPINYETLGDVYAQAVMMFDQVEWE
jgi:iron(III) transport system substrate-binding protein